MANLSFEGAPINATSHIEEGFFLIFKIIKCQLFHAREVNFESRLDKIKVFSRSIFIVRRSL